MNNRLAGHTRQTNSLELQMLLSCLFLPSYVSTFFHLLLCFPCFLPSLMDLQKLFAFKKAFHSCICIILFAILAEKTVSLDPKFTACGPQSCGIGPIIRYPFWIEQRRESYCGYPGFKIACVYGHPVLTISEDEYIVRKINYFNNSFLVGNAAFSEESCPAPQNNFSLQGTPFNYSPSHAALYLLYNCTKNTC